MDLFSLDSCSHFDCSDLQLFAIFMPEKLVGPWCVQIVYKQKVIEPNIMQYCEMFGVLVLGYMVYFKLTGPRK